MPRALAAALSRSLRALTALTTLAALIAGIPWLLIASTGWPLDWIGWPHGSVLPGPADLYTALTSPWSDGMVFGLLASIGWVLWAMFLRDVIAEGIEASAAARRGQHRPTAARHGPLRWIAAVLVGTIVSAILIDSINATLGTDTASAAADAAHCPAVAATPARSVAAVLTAPVRQARPDPARSAEPASTTAIPISLTGKHHDTGIPSWATGGPGGVHHVVAGDNLWDIAKHELGNPYRWREIYILNRGHEQANGYALTEPDMIHIGWVLALPARHAGPAAPTTPTAPGAGTTAPTDPGSSTPDNPAPSANATPSADPSTPPSPTTGNPAATPTPPSASNERASSRHHHAERGITLPSQGWISLGLAATIAALAALLRLQRRRRARLSFPVPMRTGPQPTPVPGSLAVADAAGSRQLDLDTDDEHRLPGVLPAPPAVAAPIGVDTDGTELSLFDLPGSGIALHGDGAESAARAMLASTLATGVLETNDARPTVVTTVEILARLLPDGAPLVGLDPAGRSFDGERLIVLTDAAAAVTHAEEEMIGRRRLLDTLDAETIAALNARTDHAEHQPSYVLLIEANPRHAARINAISSHRADLHMHPVALGELDGMTSLHVAAEGATTTGNETREVGRLATLTASDLAQILAMLAEAAPRPESGTDVDQPPDVTGAPPGADNLESVQEIPTPRGDTLPPVQLQVLGPPTLTTSTGPITTGMRSGSYAALALLAAHPQGRTLDQIADALHPDTDPTVAVKRIRTDITTVRRVLRAATGEEEARFITYDPVTGRYRLDADSIAVDLWHMLAAITRANNAADDTDALTALRQATMLYRGDFAEGQGRAWITDYATTYRHQILSAYAHIAEILEADHPTQAVTALERALDLDPVNEELYQRIMRIHGRERRPDAVRRTLRLLEGRLADLGDTEPTEATRRVAARQLQSAIPSGAPR
jgi:DNA-binding SARP family transcriptional activator